MASLIIGFLVIGVGIGILMKVLAQNANRQAQLANAAQPPTPWQEVPNHKVIWVSNAKAKELKAAIQQCCTHYNEQQPQLLPRLVQLTDQEHLISFPYDVQFDLLCFFINYLHYPEGIAYQPKIVGWSIMMPADAWLGERLAGQRAMLFIPESDTEYDCIYLTTEQGAGYKIGFGNTQAEALEAPLCPFSPPAIRPETVLDKPAWDFE